MASPDNYFMNKCSVFKHGKAQKNSPMFCNKHTKKTGLYWVGYKCAAHHHDVNIYAVWMETITHYFAIAKFQRITAPVAKEYIRVLSPLRLGTQLQNKIFLATGSLQLESG